MSRLRTCLLVVFLAAVAATVRAGKDGIPAELQAGLVSGDPVERVSALRKVAALETAEAGAALVPLLADPNERVVEKTVEELVPFDGETRDFIVEKVLTHREARLRAGALRVLGACGDASRASAVTGALGDKEAAVRLEAVRALGALGPAAPYEAVLGLLEREREGVVRAAALEALPRIRPAEGVAAVRAHRGDKAYEARVARLLALGEHDPEGAVADCVESLEDKDHYAPSAAAAALLAGRPRKAAVGPLIQALGRAEGRLRGDYAAALDRITGMGNGLDVAAWRLWWTYNEDSWAVPDRPADRSMKTVERGFYGLPLLSKRLAFIIDLSKSMADPVKGGSGGSYARKVDVARAELQQAIQSLDEDVRLNVVFTREAIEVLSERLVAAKRSNLKAIFAFILEREPARLGRFTPYDALVKAMEDPDLDSVYVLTDGVPTANAGTYFNRGELLSGMDRVNHWRRLAVHCVEVGEPSKAWKGFLQELADRNVGYFVKR
ncbi:MAG: HEAT repeat domain-containing protein [Planctomycetes bacterium]|nr:HEAT repeat domain-containing protein [Planctomycetota bacterium]